MRISGASVMVGAILLLFVCCRDGCDAADLPASGANPPPTRTSKLDLAGVEAAAKNIDFSGIWKAMTTIDVPTVTARYGQLKAALSKNDFVQAEQLAKELDGLLGSAWLGQTVGMLKLESEKGTDAALAAVNEFLKTPCLAESSKEIGEALSRHFQASTREDIQSVVFWIVYFSVQTKLHDPHGNDLGSFLVATAVKEGVGLGFRTYDLQSKDGKEFPDALSEATGIDKASAKNAWDDLKEIAADKQRRAKLLALVMKELERIDAERKESLQK